ncbi:hypothetical protein ACK8HX_03460 [Oryzobacter sp. R7]|uniref:hypothetical protein n=1 Tax=Oryzobacter faecalis TaxID=3388656 RepID=UPI00398D2A92
MAELVPFPRTGVVRDARGEGRALRVTWHHEDGLVVLSTWRGPTCVGTVRVAAQDVPFLVDVLVSGLGSRYAGSASTGTPPEPGAETG